MKLLPPEQAVQRTYDAVVVGGGITGAIMAKTLAKEGKDVLIVEAGTPQAASYQSYLDFLNTYYTAGAKTPNAPYPSNSSAPQPSELDPTWAHGIPDTNGYFVQYGPQLYRSSYTRYLGGTTLHWLGTSLRMLPEDFELHSRFGVASDWPIRYTDLLPHYEQAERELGVSATVEEQQYGGLHFSPGYVYPMHGLPPSWLDHQLSQALAGASYHLDGEAHELRVVGTPASRNGIPNEHYNNNRGYSPAGAVDNPFTGRRCMGNSSCVPICPIQAKYNALKTLASADDRHVTLVAQAVASRILLDPASGRVSGISFQHYRAPGDTQPQSFVVRGRVYVLAAHAVENAKLLLASDAANSSGMVGRNLMDHTTLLTWALAPVPVGPFRGPLATSGIESMRAGAFRRHSAAFRIEIGNDGWGWPANAPVSDLAALVSAGHYGPELRTRLRQQVGRQFRFASLVEQLPDPSNRVSIDPNYRDALGNYRPVLHFSLTDYTRAGFELAKHVSDTIFQRFGATDHSTYPRDDPGYFEYNGRGYSAQGAGHFMGTHRMGSSRQDSVVDPRQRTWDHDNLYLVGCGNMVTSATSNPTLTAAALTFWAARNILADLAS